MEVLSEKEYLIAKAEQICKTVLRGEIDRQELFVFAHFVKIYLKKENGRLMGVKDNDIEK